MKWRKFCFSKALDNYRFKFNFELKLTIFLKDLPKVFKIEITR